MDEKLQVLVVDDNRELCTVIKSYLTQKGFEVHVAYTAKDAMAFMEKSKRVDVVLMDLMLPDIHGLEMIKNVREHSKEVVIIVITGVKDLNTGIEAMKSGADDYLVKPFRLGELEEKINELLYKKAIEQNTNPFLTAERALKTVDNITYTGGMLKFSFKDLNELNRFLDALKRRDDVNVSDVRIDDEYEVFLTLKR